MVAELPKWGNCHFNVTNQSLTLNGCGMTLENLVSEIKSEQYFFISKQLLIWNEQSDGFFTLCKVCKVGIKCYLSPLFTTGVSSFSSFFDTRGIISPSAINSYNRLADMGKVEGDWHRWLIFAQIYAVFV